MVDHRGRKKTSPEREPRPSFADIVGQTELKQALLAVATNDGLDGLLIRGEKGTAKSTAVRALQAKLPAQRVIEDCPYGCPPARPADQCENCRQRSQPATTTRPVPLVTLPLGATRDRVVGTLSVADALAGEFEFEPGLLARANRGILYVDEVNLLDDHLVDVLLDTAASGVNTVERDSVSVSHPSQFTLIGTMNPEEGDLRPQLRDRFALQATVTACEEIDDRVEIIERAITDASADGNGVSTPTTESAGTAQGPDERDPPGRECQSLQRASERLETVTLGQEFTREIARLCKSAGVDGHRGDIATARAAKTFAALDSRSTVIEQDVRQAAELALPHRLKSRPFEETPDPEELIDDHFEDDSSEVEPNDGSERDETKAESTDTEDGGDSTSDDETSDESTDSSESEDGKRSEGENSPESTQGESGEGQTDESEEVGQSATSDQPDTQDGVEAGRGNNGETSEADDESGEDGEAGEQMQAPPIVPGQTRVDVGDATALEFDAPEMVTGSTDPGSRARTTPGVDTDGPRVRSRRTELTTQVDAVASIRAAATRGSTTVESRDLRESVRQHDTNALVLFVVDASASMRPAMRAAKGTVLELLKDAYQQRDQVGFVAFAGEDANVLLPPTDSVTLAARHLKALPTGDRTPLPAGLRTAADVLDRADPAASVVVLVTDGKANVADSSPVQETRMAARGLADRGANVVVVNAGDDRTAGLIDPIIDATDGDCLSLEALSAARIDDAAGRAYESQI